METGRLAGFRPKVLMYYSDQHRRFSRSRVSSWDFASRCAFTLHTGWGSDDATIDLGD